MIEALRKNTATESGKQRREAGKQENAENKRETQTRNRETGNQSCEMNEETVRMKKSRESECLPVIVMAMRWQTVTQRPIARGTSVCE